MSFPFSTVGRIVVPISSPGRAHDVAAGIERWLEKFKARNLHWEEQEQSKVLHFTGDHIFQWRRWICSRPAPFDGIGTCSLKFEDHPTEVIIEYALTFRLTPLPQMIAFAVLSMIFLSGGFDLTSSLIFLPIMVVIYSLLWLSGGFDFKSSLRLAATRGMADAAERELHR